MSDPDLIVGMERPDDAGVYRLNDNTALIQTLDFFTPIVDDPYLFGQIAVTNALSDVYAMGGRPILAMNIICFPETGMDSSVLNDILRGGFDKMKEAGVLLVGGHSVDDKEIKYGLSVTGTVHPDKVILNTGALPGDALVLTKPVGTGIVSTAIKAGMAESMVEAKVSDYMNTLNRKASELMAGFDVHACTDITGFGLLGHACEMIDKTPVGMVIYASKVPIFTEAVEYASMGLIPGGTYRNEKYRAGIVDMDDGISDETGKILFDPQTSGGLLISLGSRDAKEYVGLLHEQGINDTAIIGEIVSEGSGRIKVV